MNDKAFIIGVVGSIGTISLAEINEIVALTAGLLTCGYMILKLWQALRKSK
jgi:hypothetical protein